ncbi:MAG: hypothetical protein ACD_73C00393G0004 [uncultured bacterium]|nr:MAG: hypothetical protein ACD_73C00393G0004 [uncultured bacterium]
MNWDQIERNWNQFKANVKKKWAKLTDNELDMIIKGKNFRLAGNFQKNHKKYVIEKNRSKKIKKSN